MLLGNQVWILAAASCFSLSPADRPLRFHVSRYVQVSIEVRLLVLMSGCLNFVLNFVRCSLLDFLMRVIAVQIRESVRSYHNYVYIVISIEFCHFAIVNNLYLIVRS